MIQCKFKRSYLMLCCITILSWPLAIYSKNKILTLKKVKNSNNYVKKDFFNYIASLFNTTVLIETGTYNGETLNNALSCFEQLYSIELSPALYQQTLERFKNYPNVHLYLGNSSNVLLSLLPTIQGKILFWLDGHYSGGTTAKGESNTPILGELNAIKQSTIKDAVILIDDLRIFGCANHKNIDETLIGYPTVQQLLDAIREINPAYTFVIYGDIALAFISTEPVDVSSVIKACTISRFCMEQPNNQELVEAEHIIKHAQREEKEALANLYHSFACHDPYSLATLYKRWYHLISER